MHSETPAEPTQAYVFAEMRKYLRYAAVSKCRPGAAGHSPRSPSGTGWRRGNDTGFSFDCGDYPHRLSHSRSRGAAKTTTWISTGRRHHARELPGRLSRKWQPKVVDDWPDKVPIFVEELELFELYLGDDLDRILGFTK